jgi:hypothetical protein
LASATSQISSGSRVSTSTAMARTSAHNCGARSSDKINPAARVGEAWITCRIVKTTAHPVATALTPSSPTQPSYAVPSSSSVSAPSATTTPTA